MVHDTTLGQWEVTVSEVCAKDIIRTAQNTRYGRAGALARVLEKRVLDIGDTGAFGVELLVEYGDGKQCYLSPKDVSRVFWRVDHPTKGASVSAYKFTPKERK